MKMFVPFVCIENKWWMREDVLDSVQVKQMSYSDSISLNANTHAHTLAAVTVTTYIQ